MRHRAPGRPAAIVLAALSGLVSIPLRAQSAPGGGVGGPSLASDLVPLSRTIPERELVRDDMSRARLRLGPVRILPSINVWNAGYDSNVFGTSEDVVGDWTATVNAGARFLVPFGSKIVLRADAFPQYTWYNELNERDQFGGAYNASLYGFFNRLSAEIAGNYFQQYQTYSSEIDTLVFQTSKGVVGKIEVELTARWSLFGRGEYQEVRYEQIEGPPGQDLGVPLNNRTDTGGRGGLRYRISPDWNVAIAAEGVFSDFEITPELRNNLSTAYLASVEYSRPRFYLNLVGGYREGDGEDTDFFPRFTTGVGSFFASWFASPWLEIQGFGHRSVNYSITVVNPYYFENRIGGKVNIQLGSRILITGYGQVGPNNYPRAQPVGGELVQRRDESEQYGGGFSVLMWRPLVLSGRVTQSNFDSNVAGASRDYTRYTAMLSFSGTFQR